MLFKAFLSDPNTKAFLMLVYIPTETGKSTFFLLHKYLERDPKRFSLLQEEGKK